MPEYELNFAPGVNLVPVPGAWSYGRIASLTHDDIDGLYGDLEADFGVVYRPVAVSGHRRRRASSSRLVLPGPRHETWPG